MEKTTNLPRIGPKHYIGSFNCLEVSELDPLDADQPMQQLPHINANADVPSLLRLLGQLLPSHASIFQMSPTASIAAMRDIGMLLSSLKRHKQEPTKALPALNNLLPLLASKAALMPRNTVFHYGPWNPSNQRERCFTTDWQEKALIDCVRITAPLVEQVIFMLSSLQDVSLTHTAFSEICQAANQHLQVLPQAIKATVKHVTPQFFAQTLRPYFEEGIVDGHEYLGPAAANIPVCLIDLIVWQADWVDPYYRSFQEKVVATGLPEYKAIFDVHRRAPSLVQRLQDALEPAAATQDALAPPARAIYQLLLTLLQFRGVHHKIAQAAYTEELRLYEMGSGGAPVQLVRHIMQLTKKHYYLTKEQLQTNHTTN